MWMNFTPCTDLLTSSPSPSFNAVHMSEVSSVWTRTTFLSCLPQSSTYNGFPPCSVSYIWNPNVHMRCIYLSLSSSTPSSALRSGHAVQTVARSSSIVDLFDIDVNSYQQWMMPHFPLWHAQGVRRGKKKICIHASSVRVQLGETKSRASSCSNTRFQAFWKEWGVLDRWWWFDLQFHIESGNCFWVRW